MRTTREAPPQVWRTFSPLYKFHARTRLRDRGHAVYYSIHLHSLVILLDATRRMYTHDESGHCEGVHAIEFLSAFKDRTCVPRFKVITVFLVDATCFVLLYTESTQHAVIPSLLLLLLWLILHVFLTPYSLSAPPFVARESPHTLSSLILLCFSHSLFPSCSLLLRFYFLLCFTYDRSAVCLCSSIFASVNASTIVVYGYKNDHDRPLSSTCYLVSD